LQKQGDDCVGGFARAQGFEGEAEREEIKDERDEFLIDVRQRDPMLTVAREDEHEQRGDEGGRFAVGEDLEKVHHAARPSAKRTTSAKTCHASGWIGSGSW
jgi:hypothetical protein